MLVRLTDAIHGLRSIMRMRGRVWNMDLRGYRLLVHRDLESSPFQTNLILKSGESVFASAFPDVRFAASELLG